MDKEAIEKYKEERNADIIAKRKDGWTLHDIGVHHDLSISMVSRICQGVFEEGESAIGGLRNEKTREVGRFIFAYMAQHQGRSPEIRDIARGVMGAESGRSMSNSIVSRKLDVLVNAGIIEIAEGSIARGIRIVGAQYIVPELPDELKEVDHG
jgi:hypothetical protein